MSSRLTKKSLVSVPGRSVKTPCRTRRCWRRGRACHRRAPSSPARSASSRFARSTSSFSGGSFSPARGSCGSRRPRGSSTANVSTSVCSCEASVRPGVNGTVMSCAGVLRRLLHGGAAAEDDQVGQRDRLPPDCEPLKSDWIRSSVRQHRGELGRVVDRPVLLRRQPDAGAVGAAALVGGRGSDDADAHAVRTSWGTDRPEPSSVSFSAATSASSTSSWSTGGHRVLPQLRLGHPRAEVARHRPHVAVHELVPGARRRRRRAPRGARGSVARSARRPGRTRSARSEVSIVGLRVSSPVSGSGMTFAGVLGDPLLRAGRALGQLPLEAEQVLEEVVAPLRRRLASR